MLEDRLYVLQELSQTLQVQTVPKLSDDISSVISRVSILPTDGPQFGAEWSAGTLIIPPRTQKFATPYIYVANRNLGLPDARGDSIAIFELVNKGTEDEKLVLVKQVYTGLNQIRTISVGPQKDGGDEYIIASGQAGRGGVAIFQRVDGGRDLKEVVRNVEVPNRTSFLWL